MMSYSNHNPSPTQDGIPSMGNTTSTPYRPMVQARMGRGSSAQQIVESNRPMDPVQQHTPSMDREPPPGYQMTPPNNAYDHSLVSTQMDSHSKKRPAPVPDSQLEHPRKRASVACNICRSRKSRCDGGRPKCKLCSELGADCIYQEPGIKLDTGAKLIIERLDELRAHFGLIPSSDLHETAILATRYGSVPRASIPSSMEQRVAQMQVPDGRGGPPRDVTSPARLPLDQWPKLRDMVIGPYSPVAMQDLESGRPLLPPDASLSLDFTNNDALVPHFFEVVNYILPIIDENAWAQIYESARSVEYREGLDSCLVLLVLALGAACSKGPLVSLPPDTETSGLPYFRAATQLLALTIVDRSAVSMQCTVLTSLYYLYLMRPMEAYSWISTLPHKLQLLPRQTEDTIISRLIHATSLICSSFSHINVTPESSLIQLSDSSRYPVSAGLPYSDQPATTWPFVAQLAYHRLYLRIMNDTTLPDATQGSISTALDQQLTDWWCTQVPFPDRQAAVPPPRGPLPYPILAEFRIKYFHARLQIFKPYLIGVLTDETLHMQPLTFCKDSSTCALDSAIRMLEDLSSLAESTMMVLNPFANLMAVTDAALIVVACSMSVNLMNLLPDGKVLEGILEGASGFVGRWAQLSPAVARAAEALRQAEGRRAGTIR